jgi:hypothetical protein
MNTTIKSAFLAVGAALVVGLVAHFGHRSPENVSGPAVRPTPELHGEAWLRKRYENATPAEKERLEKELAQGRTQGPVQGRAEAPRMTPDEARAELRRLKAAPPNIGDSRDQVLDYLGKPSRVNRTVLGGRVTEQWVYEPTLALFGGRGWNGYVYFNDGRVTGYQEQE